MYELLLGAYVVVADLSTSNANAIYELGVRHALRPHTTIVIAEKNVKFPFDIGHLLVRPYTHLGDGIDSEDAEAGFSCADLSFLHTTASRFPHFTLLDPLPNAIDQLRHL